ASVGLAAAYFLSDQLGWDQESLSWTLAIVGFAIGVPYDYRELQAGQVHQPSRSSGILASLGFSWLLRFYWCWRTFESLPEPMFDVGAGAAQTSVMRQNR